MDNSDASPQAARAKAAWNFTPLEGVRRVVAIASGKGGVGKSTTAVNLARALTAQGKKAGLLDADIHGPSLPRMMGVSGQPEIKNGRMIPLVKDGITCMSLGFIIEGNAAVMRGPMITKTLYQLARLTQWDAQGSALDVLLVDMPPGTGDVHLSMAQQVPLDGVIIVTTPQDVAVEDAAKCAQMFAKLKVKLLGVVENMSAFTDAAGNRIAMFGEGGGKRLAEAFNMPLLGQVPLDIAIREAADAGQALSSAHVAQEAYLHISQAMLQKL